jgi:hypothetical protein
MSLNEDLPRRWIKHIKMRVIRSSYAGNACGLAYRETNTVGKFYVDLTRGLCRGADL